jgi:REP element-mobilizing transposase RayT
MHDSSLTTRKHIRLKDYDYSSAGAYFVTICTESRHRLFGTISDNQLSLNEVGELTQYWLNKTTLKFPRTTILKSIIMPNHIHFIVLMNAESLNGDKSIELSVLVQWFKTMVTNAYIQGVKLGHFPPFNKRIWQRNYYEHVVRDEQDLERVWEYIDLNVHKWSEDEYFSND